MKTFLDLEFVSITYVLSKATLELDNNYIVVVDLKFGESSFGSYTVRVFDNLGEMIIEEEHIIADKVNDLIIKAQKYQKREE